MSPWFENRKHYVANQMKMFRDTGRLAVATYGFKQGSSMSNNFGPDKTPWLLNSVYAGRTIRPNADGTAAFNYAWIDDFRSEEHTSELQSLMRISYAVFCLKKKNDNA